MARKKFERKYSIILIPVRERLVIFLFFPLFYTFNVRCVYYMHAKVANNSEK